MPKVDLTDKPRGARHCFVCDGFGEVYIASFDIFSHCPKCEGRGWLGWDERLLKPDLFIRRE